MPAPTSASPPPLLPPHAPARFASLLSLLASGCNSCGSLSCASRKWFSARSSSSAAAATRLSSGERPCLRAHARCDSPSVSSACTSPMSHRRCDGSSERPTTAAVELICCKASSSWLGARLVLKCVAASVAAASEPASANELSLLLERCSLLSMSRAEGSSALDCCSERSWGMVGGSGATRLPSPPSSPASASARASDAALLLRPRSRACCSSVAAADSASVQLAPLPAQTSPPQPLPITPPLPPAPLPPPRPARPSSCTTSFAPPSDIEAGGRCAFWL
mmetsp:Transcript_46500/g.101016  ORF Transcript_46500/g.101016 Transcript_46500/m.101016 type:complete len:279 (+) Transcript_46500:501-1337(+)